MVKNHAANNAIDRSLHPRHASCVRTCRAGVPPRSLLTFDPKMKTTREDPGIRRATMTWISGLVIINMMIQWVGETRLPGFSDYLNENYFHHSVPITTSLLFSGMREDSQWMWLVGSSILLLMVTKLRITNSVLRIGCFLLVLTFSVRSLLLLVGMMEGPMDAIRAMQMP